MIFIPSTLRTTALAAALLTLSASHLAQAADPAVGHGPIPIASVKQVHINLQPTANSIMANDTIIRATTPQASFVKLHFEYFSLPAGAVLEVSDASGKEVYRYSAAKLGPHTVEAKRGENGKTSFAAMSVTGDQARVKIHLNGAKWDFAKHGVRIREVMEGFSEVKIAEVMRQADEGMSPESTCGVNERKDAVCFATSNPAEFERSRAVARMVMAGGLCTAWRVGSDNRMMTNNHCVKDQAETAASEVWFNYQKTTCGGSVMAPVTKVNAVTLLKTDATLDYSLFTISDLPAIASFGNYGLDVRTPIKDEQIFIPQHGAGNPKELAVTSDQNNGGVCRIDVAVQNGRGTNTDTGYKCDTTGGSSGSPVLATSSKKVIALHHLGGCPSSTNSGALISLIWPQIATYFNNVVPNGDNGTPTPTPTTTPITANVAKTNLSGALGSETFYVLDLTSPPSTLKFVTSGGTGDLDMYVKYGSMPSMSNADCKSETVGSVETCSMTSPKAGKYYVLLKGHAAYASASLLAETTSAPGNSYQNTTRYSIPDNNSTGISSSITVPRTGASNTVSVDVNLTHTYIGDLVVSLIAPNGKVFSLHNRAGGSADNIIKTFTVNVGTIASNGTWKLRVVDSARVDQGTLNSWKLSFAN